MSQNVGAHGGRRAKREPIPEVAMGAMPVGGVLLGWAVGIMKSLIGERVPFLLPGAEFIVTTAVITIVAVLSLMVWKTARQQVIVLSALGLWSLALAVLLAMDEVVSPVAFEPDGPLSSAVIARRCAIAGFAVVGVGATAAIIRYRSRGYRWGASLFAGLSIAAEVCAVGFALTSWATRGRFAEPGTWVLIIGVLIGSAVLLASAMAVVRGLPARWRRFVPAAVSLACLAAVVGSIVGMVLTVSSMQSVVARDDTGFIVWVVAAMVAMVVGAAALTMHPQGDGAPSRAAGWGVAVCAATLAVAVPSSIAYQPAFRSHGGTGVTAGSTAPSAVAFRTHAAGYSADSSIHATESGLVVLDESSIIRSYDVRSGAQRWSLDAGRLCDTRQRPEDGHRSSSSRGKEHLRPLLRATEPDRVRFACWGRAGIVDADDGVLLSWDHDDARAPTYDPPPFDTDRYPLDPTQGPFSWRIAISEPDDGRVVDEVLLPAGDLGAFGYVSDMFISDDVIAFPGSGGRTLLRIISEHRTVILDASMLIRPVVLDSGHVLFSVNDGRDLRVFDLASGKPVATVERPCTTTDIDAIGVAGDGAYVTCGSKSERVEVVGLR